MNSNRDLMPYLLLALLFVATELGIALGASQAPETHTAAPLSSVPVPVPAPGHCTESPTLTVCSSSGVQGSSSSIGIAPSGTSLPTGVEACLNKRLAELPEGAPQTANETLRLKDLARIFTTCEGQH